GLTQEELDKVIAELDETNLKILKEIRRGPVQSGVLGQKLELASSAVRERALKLKTLGLIRTKEGAAGGYDLAAKGVEICRQLMVRERDATKKVENGLRWLAEASHLDDDGWGNLHIFIEMVGGPAVAARLE